MDVYHSKLMIFYDWKKSKIFFGHLFTFRPVYWFPVYYKFFVCSRFQAERLRKDMIKMAVNQQEILHSELRAILITFITKIDINKEQTDTEKSWPQLLQYLNFVFTNAYHHAYFCSMPLQINRPLKIAPSADDFATHCQ